jgi:hypothetical protein
MFDWRIVAALGAALLLLGAFLLIVFLRWLYGKQNGQLPQGSGQYDPQAELSRATLRGLSSREAMRQNRLPRDTDQP